MHMMGFVRLLAIQCIYIYLYMYILFFQSHMEHLRILVLSVKQRPQLTFPGNQLLLQTSEVSSHTTGCAV